MLEITVAAGAAGPVLTLSGETDLGSATALSQALTAQLSGGARHLTVDAAGLAFADSASVRALVLAGVTLKERGGVLVLAHPRPAVARVLSLLGADQVLTIRAGTSAGPEPDSTRPAGRTVGTPPPGPDG